MQMGGPRRAAAGLRDQGSDLQDWKMRDETIRKAAKEDASRLAEIQIFSKRKAYRPIFQNDKVSFNEMQVLPLALFYRDFDGALDDIYVFDDGIVKGMMKWSCGDSAIWELKELYVDPFFQGAGIGTSLMNYFLAAAVGQKAGGAMLWVLEENISAIRFYEKQGYSDTGEKKKFPGTENNLLKYRKIFESKQRY